MIPAAQVRLPVEPDWELLGFNKLAAAQQPSPGLVQVGDQTEDAAAPCGSTKVRRVWTHSCYRKLTADDHALQLLAWLQAQPLLAGCLVPAGDLEALYWAFCESIKWKTLSWQCVGAAYRRLSRGQRVYRRINGRNVCCHFIPAPFER